MFVSVYIHHYDCLCTKCYPDVKTEEKRKTLGGGNPSTNSKARPGLHPIKRAISALVIVG